MGYMQDLKNEVENQFIERAAGAIQKGRSWSDFIAECPQFSVMPTGHYAELYSEMQGRRRHDKTGHWGAAQELQLAADRRKAEAIREGENRQYMEMKDDLIKWAGQGASWEETRQRLGLLPDCEGLFRRAQQECGRSQKDERDDPYDAAFHLGFMG